MTIIVDLGRKASKKQTNKTTCVYWGKHGYIHREKQLSYSILHGIQVFVKNKGFPKNKF